MKKLDRYVSIVSIVSQERDFDRPEVHQNPENPDLKLATALVERRRQENRTTFKRFSELTGQEPPPNYPSPSVEKMMDTAVANLLAETLADPTKTPTSVIDFIRNLDAEPFEEMHRLLQEEDPKNPIPLTVSQFRAWIQNGVEQILNPLINFNSNILASGDKIEEETVSFIRQIEETRRLAEEKGINPVTVWQEDDLYAELIRRLWTPEEWVAINTKTTDKITREYLIEHLIKVSLGPLTALATVPYDENAEDDLEGGPEEFMRELLEEIQEDPEFLRGIDDFLSRTRRAAGIMIEEKVVELWGEGVLPTLSEKTQAELQALLGK